MRFREPVSLIFRQPSIMYSGWCNTCIEIYVLQFLQTFASPLLSLLSLSVHMHLPHAANIDAILALTDPASDRASSSGTVGKEM